MEPPSSQPAVEPRTDELDLEPGEPLQLQYAPPADGRARLQAQVIGVLPGRSVIITAPMQGYSRVMPREGQAFIVRSFVHKRVLGFSCAVLRTCTHPYPYVHLSYPRHLEKVTVRGARRVKTSLGATVEQERADGGYTAPEAATVSDLSTSGAMLQTRLVLVPERERVRINLQLPLEQMEPQTVSIDGVVTVAYEETADEPRRYGIRFEELDDAAKLVLRVYVYENLLGDDK